MYTKFKKETPSLQLDKESFVKVSKAMGVEASFVVQ